LNSPVKPNSTDGLSERAVESAGLHVCSYEWRTREDFFLAGLFPARMRLEARPGETAAAILERLPACATHFFFHLNCTHTSRFVEPREVLIEELELRGVTVINAGITDISKRHLAAVCFENGLNSVVATPEGDPDELVIAKTNANCGGSAERDGLTPAERTRLGVPEDTGLVRSLLARFKEYPVLRRRDVPPSWWQDKQLAIERFISNSADRFYRVHVLLDRLSMTEAICAGPVKKLGDHLAFKRKFFYTVSKEVLDIADQQHAKVIDQVLLAKKHLKFDFAGLDVVIDENGTPFVIDVNTTPFVGPDSQHLPMMVFLRAAIAEGRS
jgi:hypothetical protein